MNSKMKLIGLCIVIAASGLLVFSTRHQANETEEEETQMKEIEVALKAMTPEEKKDQRLSLSSVFLLEIYGEDQGQEELIENIRNSDGYKLFQKTVTEDPALSMALENFKPLLKDVVAEKTITKSDLNQKVLALEKALEKYPQYKEVLFKVKIIFWALQ